MPEEWADVAVKKAGGGGGTSADEMSEEKSRYIWQLYDFLSTGVNKGYFDTAYAQKIMNEELALPWDDKILYKLFSGSLGTMRQVVRSGSSAAKEVALKNMAATRVGATGPSKFVSEEQPRAFVHEIEAQQAIKENQQLNKQLETLQGMQYEQGLANAAQQLQAQRDAWHRGAIEEIATAVERGEEIPLEDYRSKLEEHKAMGPLAPTGIGLDYPKLRSTQDVAAELQGRITGQSNFEQWQRRRTGELATQLQEARRTWFDTLLKPLELYQERAKDWADFARSVAGFGGVSAGDLRRFSDRWDPQIAAAQSAASGRDPLVSTVESYPWWKEWMKYSPEQRGEYGSKYAPRAQWRV